MRATFKPGPIFDAHFHVIDPRYPLTENQGFRPDAFPVDRYRAAVDALDVRGGAVVSGSFQGFDHSYIGPALAALHAGGGQWVGVVQAPAHISDEQILELHAVGVRGVRFNLMRGLTMPPSELVALARRVHVVAGWHSAVYADAASLAPLADALSALPALVIDHLGMNEAGLPVVLDLVRAGARVKATGFGRVALDIPGALQRIAACNPAALLFGTDLPSTRARRAFHPTDQDLLYQVLGDDLARKITWDNPRAFYGLDTAPNTPRASTAA